ncbi:MAG: ParB/RepB/Spo0J family partition protein [Clostridiales bacterium]|nr:ParB/RepB/Spo0J family partition protein [Clostridiales bacterium]
MKRTGLGRGLDALFPEEPGHPLADGPVYEVPLSDIDPNPNQPRKNFNPEKLRELTESIREHGVLQPLLLCRRGERYLLVAGERRWRAARLAGLSLVPAVVQDLTDEQILAVSLVENLQRDDLNPLEEAEGFQQLMDRFDMTQAEVARRVGRSRPVVANALRLLTLPDPVRELVREGSLSAGHARSLAGIEDASQQCALARQAVEKGLSVRQIEALSRQEKSPYAQDQPAFDPAMSEFRESLQQLFGTRVQLRGDLNRGSIIINYFNRDDLERIYDLMTSLSSSK